MKKSRRLAASTSTDKRSNPNAVEAVIALVSLFASFAVFFVVFSGLHARTGDRLTALPEVDELIVSVDVGAQQSAFLSALAVLIVVWVVMFFVGDSVRSVIGKFIDAVRPLAERRRDAVSGGGQSTKTGVARGSLLSWIDAALGVILLLLLAMILRTILLDRSFDPQEIVMLMSGDPHTYVIYGRACEILRGTIVSNGEHEAYGPGGSLLYCGLRALGFDASYVTALQLNKSANLAMVMVLTLCLWRYWQNAIAGSLRWQLAAAIALIAAVRPLLVESGSLVVYANLSCLRYVPVMVFLLFACCTTWHSRPRDRALRVLASAVGVVLFPDTGVLAAIGFAVMEGASGFDRGDVVRRGASSLLATGALVLLTSMLLSPFFSRSGLEFSHPLYAAANYFGGKIVKWDSTMFLLTAVAILTATVYVSASGRARNDQRAQITAVLNRSQGIALATSVMLIAWIPYYLHRPSHYIIYSLLALFPLSRALQRVPLLPGSLRSLGAALLIAICLIVFAPHKILPSLGAMLRTDNSRSENWREWSGLSVPRTFAEHMSERLAALDRIRTRDALVVTGIPFAIAASGRGMRGPIEVLFTLGRERDLARFIRRLNRERPKMLILDGKDSPAWGAQAIQQIVSRIEMGIMSNYERLDSSSHWRVWVPKR